MVAFLIMVILTVFVIAGVYCMNLITKKDKTYELMIAVESQYKKRNDLLLDFLTFAKKIMVKEDVLISEINALKAKTLNYLLPKNKEDVRKKIEIEAKLDKKMKDLIILTENYPQFKSDLIMRPLMDGYNENLEQLKKAKKDYNEALNNYIAAISSPAGSFVANWLKFDVDEVFLED